MRTGLAFAAAAVFAALTLAPPALASPDTVVGRWLNARETGFFEISRCGESVCGKIIGGKAEGGPERDVKNPDPALRNRPLVGMQFMEGYRRTNTGWVGGRIYDPGRGQWFRSELIPQSNGTLQMKGCLGPVCQTQVWHRAPADLAPGRPPAD